MQNKKCIKRDNSKIKTHSGITLIALIITIIVLLILAGVTIATLTGDSGILSNAEKAKEETLLANSREQVQLAVQAALVEGLGTVTKTELVAELNNLVGQGKYTITPDNEVGPWTVIITQTGYEATINSAGNITEDGGNDSGDGGNTEGGGNDSEDDGNTEEANISINLTLSYENETLDASELPNVKEVTSENVPIPEGFYHVAGTVKDTGLVISSVSGDNLNNDAKGNQFVWVPVNKNQKLTLEVTTKEDITGITLIGPDGVETEVTPSEKQAHTQEITMTKNGVYSVEVQTASETKIERKRVSSLYAQDIEMLVLQALKEYTRQTYETVAEFEAANEGITIEQVRETGLAVYGMQTGIFIEELQEETKAEGRALLNQMYSYVDYNQNVESVEKYGGFYIARFEAGDGTTDKVRDTDSLDTNTLVSQKGEYVYSLVDSETAKTLSTGMYSESSYVTSQLIAGAGWDRTMNWLVETGMDDEKVLYDSRSWGNYENSIENALTDSGSSNMNWTTGRSEYWKANNIYDLAGNTAEWTQEMLGSENIYRGGQYKFSGVTTPASCRSYDLHVDANSDVAFRIQLFIR